MTTSRAQLRAHAGKQLPRGYYVSGTTTVAATLNTEIIDANRTENDDYWNGAVARVGTEDRPLRGGAGASTTITPKVFTDVAFTSAVALSTNYEILKGWSFQQFDEAIDDTLMDSWPYFFDSVDDLGVTVTLADQVIEYALPATWRHVQQIEMQIAASVPTRYQALMPGYAYNIDEQAASLSLRLRFIPTGSLVGLKLRIKAHAIPTLAAADSSTTVHPYHVLVPGILANLYRQGVNPDEGALQTRLARQADLMQALFEKRLHRFAIARAPVDTKIPFVSVL